MAKNLNFFLLPSLKSKILLFLMKIVIKGLAEIDLFYQESMNTERWIYYTHTHHTHTHTHTSKQTSNQNSL